MARGRTDFHRADWRQTDRFDPIATRLDWPRWKYCAAFPNGQAAFGTSGFATRAFIDLLYVVYQFRLQHIVANVSTRIYAPTNRSIRLGQAIHSDRKSTR